jgi:hypothetical protein
MIGKTIRYFLVGLIISSCSNNSKSIEQQVNNCIEDRLGDRIDLFEILEDKIKVNSEFNLKNTGNIWQFHEALKDSNFTMRMDSILITSEFISLNYPGTFASFLGCYSDLDIKTNRQTTLSKFRSIFIQMEDKNSLSEDDFRKLLNVLNREDISKPVYRRLILLLLWNDVYNSSLTFHPTIPIENTKELPGDRSTDMY